MTGTIKVHNVSLNTSEQDISEFFSFSGDIVYVELQRLVPYDLHHSMISFVQNTHNLTKNAL